jgi:hypothetical protein
MSIETYYLAAPNEADAKPALTMDTLPKTVNGIPVFYFWRQAIRDGEYKHPSLGFRVPVDLSRRQQWESSFKKLQANGVAVPIVKDHKETADNTLGYVVDVKNEGLWLWELHQYLGDADRDTALKNKISIGINPNFKDGQGRAYGDTIIHSAITPAPIVDGQGEAVPLSANSGGSQSALLLLATERTGPMPVMLSDEQFNQIKGLLGGEVTPENCAAKIVEALGAKQTATANLSRAQEQLTAVNTQVTSLQAQVTELSRTGPRVPDKDTLEELAEVDTASLDHLVDQGCLTRGACDKLKPALLGAKDSRNVLTLSRNGDKPRLTRAIIDALKENKPQPGRGETTRTQTLSRTTTDDDKGGDGGADKNPLLDTAKQMYGK